MSLKATLLLATIWVAMTLLVGETGASAASNWTVVLHAGSSGEGHSQTLPAAPGSVTATCATPTTNTTITVSWAAVTHATTYTVLQSFKGGTYTAAASVSTTSWSSSSSLAAGSYQYEIEASIGTNWLSSASSASAKRTVQTSSPFCK